MEKTARSSERAAGQSALKESLLLPFLRRSAFLWHSLLLSSNQVLEGLTR